MNLKVKTDVLFKFYFGRRRKIILNIYKYCDKWFMSLSSESLRNFFLYKINKEFNELKKCNFLRGIKTFFGCVEIAREYS